KNLEKEVISPKLIPIEAVWERMKDQTQYHHPNLGRGRQRTQGSLRSIVKEAWDSVSPKDLMGLIESMLARCKAVIDVDWGPTKY
ncbi:hypothetical protein EPUL_006453, partial [Erysiphe pulchra]